MPSTNDRINAALAEVRRLIEELVRKEQLTDGLTGLANDIALSNDLTSKIVDGVEFWCAFVEIDHFKRLNDAFGYQIADAMLKSVARHLTLAKEHFQKGPEAYRAHGDEFFLVGSLGDESQEQIEERLNALRINIEKVQIAVEGREPMKCTVSIGWYASNLSKEALTERSIRNFLESAVALAKRQGRNRVVKYDEKARKAEVRSLRDNCQACSSAFTLDVPLEHEKKEQLHCPNCGNRIDRPAAPNPPPQPTEV